jgi:hypothetical protein
MLVEGQRYLFLSYGALHKSGIFRRMIEMSPGCTVIEIDEVTVIGETGDIGRAQREMVYEQGQSGPLDGVSWVPWHDVQHIIPQGAR